MTTQASSKPGGRVRQVGRVLAELTITNRADEVRAADGTITPAEIRSITLSGVLVDTGANTLCLPKSMVERLGLTPLREVQVQTATGISRATTYDDARLTVMGRSGTFECLELPDEAVPLLGLFPLEGLGLELDLQRETLRVLPDFGPNTYWTA